MQKITPKKATVIILSSLLSIGMAGGIFFTYQRVNTASNDHESYIAMKDGLIQEQMLMGKYACCLEKPCTYCLEKSPKHGEGLACTCLEDIINGVHPCGECIGEIMEGHGNAFLSKYFAKAIAEEVGEQYLPFLKKIMTDKYDITISDQL